MKTKALRPVSFLFILCAFSFSSCKKDKCEQTFTYKTYEPVYMSYNEMRASVKSLPAQPLKKPGKIYLKGNYIFVNEIDKGIHIFDNSNPSSPQNVAFINIPGNLDMAATGNVLYADNYVDLLALDISNPKNILVLNHVENALPYRTYTNGGYADPQKGVVTEWKEVTKTEKINADCGGGSGYYYPTYFEGDVLANSTGVAVKSSVSAPGIGGSMARFTIANNTLFVVDQSNLRLFNISAPALPVASGTSYVGRNIETIFPYNNHLFIGSSDGMYIYNINNPASPSYVSTYIHGTACDPVVVDDDYAYITLRSGTPCNTTFNQLEVVNIQNLYNPQLSHTVPMTNPHGLGKDNDVLFVCDGTDGLKVFDAANPVAIPTIPSVTFSNIQATDVIPFNNRLLMIGSDGLYQYDYSDVQNISLLSKILAEQ